MEITRSLKITINHDTNKSMSEYEYDTPYLAMQKLAEFLREDQRISFLRWFNKFDQDAIESGR